MSPPLAVSKLSAVPLSAPAALALGSQIEDYTVLKVLAEGRHGFVYLTRHAVHGTTCVLKEFMPRLHAMRLGDGSVSPRHAGDAIAMSVARLEFMQEATTLAGIEQPGLVRVLGLIEANRTLYRVMPFYDGVTLQQHCRLRGGGVPSVAWLAGIVDDLLRALEPVHARGRAHGRVQPNQVLVSSTQQATLLGFGSVARELDDPPADPWRAPEGSGAHRHLRPEPAGDLYALAATMWFAATGVAPPTTAERRASPPPGARELLAGVGDRADDPPHLRRGLIQALDAGLAAAIGSRPQTVAEFRRLLQGESSIQVLPVTMVPRWVGAEVAAAGLHGPLHAPPPGEPASAAAEGVEPTLRVVAASATVGLAEVAHAPSARVDAMRGGAAAIVPPAAISVLATAAPLDAAPGETVPVSIAAADAGLAAAAPVVAGSDVAAAIAEAVPGEVAPAEPVAALTEADQPPAAPVRVAAAPAVAADVVAEAAQATPVDVAPPSREAARPAEPEVSSAALPPAPGLDSLRRSRWRGAALVVAAAVLAAASVHWWTPTGEVAPSPVASRQAPTVAPRERAPVAPLGTRVAPVAPALSPTDAATPPPAGVAVAAQANPAAEAPAAVVAAVSAAAPPAPPRAAPRRAALARARAQAPRTVMSRTAAPRATPRPTTLKAVAPRAAPPRAPSVPSAKGVGTRGKPGLPQSPVAACAKAAQFSSCMQQLCANPGRRQHVQCVQFRREA